MMFLIIKCKHRNNKSAVGIVGLPLFLIENFERQNLNKIRMP